MLQVNCKNTLEGVYQFHYEFQDNVGICNNPENRLISCQEPGSAYDDNTRIRQYYRTCPGNTRSKNESESFLDGTVKKCCRHHFYFHPRVNACLLVCFNVHSLSRDASIEIEMNYGI